MEYELRLAGRPAFPLKSWGNLAVEVAASLAGVKPVIQAWVPEPDVAYAESLCRFLGWRLLRHDLQGGRVGLMLGKDPSRLEQAARDWATPGRNPGKALGYPRCCASFYWAWNPAGSSGDIVPHIRRNTPRRDAPLPFLLNDCFYLFSRGGRPEDSGRRAAIESLNAGLDLNALNVLPWHPCSYRCRSSLFRARRAWRFLRARVPGLAARLEARLKGPVLFWDWHAFAALDARPSGRGAWSVRGLRAPYAPLGLEAERELRAGGELRRKGPGWELRRGGRVAWSAGGESPFLLDFR